MSFSKLIEVKNNFKLNPNNSCKNLYKGACVKIKNSQKTFQVVGINPQSKVCWIRAVSYTHLTLPTNREV